MVCAWYFGEGGGIYTTAVVYPPANHVDPNPSNNSAKHVVVEPSLFKDGFEDATVPPLCDGI